MKHLRKKLVLTLACLSAGALHPVQAHDSLLVAKPAAANPSATKPAAPSSATAKPAAANPSATKPAAPSSATAKPAAKAINLAGRYTNERGDVVGVRPASGGAYWFDVRLGQKTHFHAEHAQGMAKVVDEMAVVAPIGCPNCEFRIRFKDNAELMLLQEPLDGCCNMEIGDHATGVYSRNPGKHRAQPRSTPHGAATFVDMEGKLAIPQSFLRAEQFSEGLAAAQDSASKKWGFIDHAGKVVVPFEYESARWFSQDLAAVEIGGKWGYIDRANKLVVKPAYDDIRGFSPEGFDVVSHSGVEDYHLDMFYIDRSGTRLTKHTYFRCEPFREGLGIVVNNVPHGMACGAVDSTGNEVIPPKYETMGSFHDGLANFQEKLDSKYGFLNKKGKVAIEARYEYTRDFHEGLAAVLVADSNVSNKQRWGYIDTSGKLVITPHILTEPGDFHDGVAIVLPEKSPCWKVIDKSGKIVGTLPFGYIVCFSERFYEGVAIVEMLDWDGSYINLPVDTTGKVLPPFLGAKHPPLDSGSYKSEGLFVTKFRDDP